MSRRARFIAFVAVVVALPFIGYTMTYMLTSYFVLHQQPFWVQMLLYFVIIIALLAVPYWMLKMVSQAAHEMNPEEKNIHLKDLVKDQDRLNKA